MRVSSTSATLVLLGAPCGVGAVGFGTSASTQSYAGHPPRVLQEPSQSGTFFTGQVPSVFQGGSLHEAAHDTGDHAGESEDEDAGEDSGDDEDDSDLDLNESDYPGLDEDGKAIMRTPEEHERYMIDRYGEEGRKKLFLDETEISDDFKKTWHTTRAEIETTYQQMGGSRQNSEPHNHRNQKGAERALRDFRDQAKRLAEMSKNNGAETSSEDLAAERRADEAREEQMHLMPEAAELKEKLERKRAALQAGKIPSLNRERLKRVQDQDQRVGGTAFPGSSNGGGPSLSLFSPWQQPPTPDMRQLEVDEELADAHKTSAEIAEALIMLNDALAFPDGSGSVNGAKLQEAANQALQLAPQQEMMTPHMNKKMNEVQTIFDNKLGMFDPDRATDPQLARLSDHETRLELELASLGLHKEQIADLASFFLVAQQKGVVHEWNFMYNFLKSLLGGLGRYASCGSCHCGQAVVDVCCGGDDPSGCMLFCGCASAESKEAYKDFRKVRNLLANLTEVEVREKIEDEIKRARQALQAYKIREGKIDPSVLDEAFADALHKYYSAFAKYKDEIEKIRLNEGCRENVLRSCFWNSSPLVEDSYLMDCLGIKSQRERDLENNVRTCYNLTYGPHGEEPKRSNAYDQRAKWDKKHESEQAAPSEEFYHEAAVLKSQRSTPAPPVACLAEELKKGPVSILEQRLRSVNLSNTGIAKAQALFDAHQGTGSCNRAGANGGTQNLAAQRNWYLKAAVKHAKEVLQHSDEKGKEETTTTPSAPPPPSGTSCSLLNGAASQQLHGLYPSTTGKNRLAAPNSPNDIHLNVEFLGDVYSQVLTKPMQLWGNQFLDKEGKPLPPTALTPEQEFQKKPEHYLNVLKKQVYMKILGDPNKMTPEQQQIINSGGLLVPYGEKGFTAGELAIKHLRSLKKYEQAFALYEHKRSNYANVYGLLLNKPLAGRADAAEKKRQ
ncbi:unnamed protein product [Amoebophrya sp. A25]|nr:unnamed protein product [Amoebophrya sp. A25]|eukprot:GSA25T00019845001.1